jgi:hypothetical protein
MITAENAYMWSDQGLMARAIELGRMRMSGFEVESRIIEEELQRRGAVSKTDRSVVVSIENVKGISDLMAMPGFAERIAEAIKK